MEYQTKEKEAQRNDKEFSHVSSWEFRDQTNLQMLWKEHKEKLSFEKVKLSQRNYK